MTMITPSYLGETIEYSSLHACRSTLEDPKALRLIEPVKADGSVRGVLMALAAKDQSQYIKSQARTMLAQLPEID